MATVVRGTENRDQFAIGKALKTIHHTFVRSDNHGEWMILFKELLHPVGAELDDSASAIWVPCFVGCHSRDRVIVRRITPQQVGDALLNWCLWNLSDMKWPLQCSHFCHRVDRATNTAMETKDLVLDHCSHWKKLKGPVEFVPTRFWIFRLLIQAASAFITEAVNSIYCRILVIPPDQMNLSRIFYLEGEKKTNGLQRECPPVHEVT
mmetsp:Transcript_12427/g.15450  ORF Transcript_12427/g.15450 Transcript_12427/m.15450 type:complete len:207 (-) Transcript_12427:1565-2185(-)